ncbi:MAG TPA: hypothetical protein VJ971_19940 [Methylomirabilota bacterium]|nr:hypothetical protein [Methylomirabilota bacterium]
MNIGGVATSAGLPCRSHSNARHELSIEDADFAVEDDRAGAQSSDGGHELGEAPRVIAARPADELDPVAVLVGEHVPAVVFLLAHPALMADRT